jgi:hypothetical protein
MIQTLKEKITVDKDEGNAYLQKSDILATDIFSEPTFFSGPASP